MSEALSPNTKAILLLTAPLIVGQGEKSADLLTPGEYKKLALYLREQKRQPAELLTPAAAELVGGCARLTDTARLERLLARGFLLSQAVERWQARAIWIVSRADAAYPKRLKDRLREDSPAILYGCGKTELLDGGGLAVVGSRHADDAGIEYAHKIGHLVASAKRTLVSGGARGIDQAAMRGAAEAGGKVTGVLADSLERTAMNREHRDLLLQGRLVLISPYDPAAGFNVGHAMQRNKLIYALADAALVVSADLNKGGTWAGATEELQKPNHVPVYVRSRVSSTGLDALQKKGAWPWPDPSDAEGLEAALVVAGSSPSSLPRQSPLAFEAPPHGEQSVREGEARSSAFKTQVDTEPSGDDGEFLAAEELFRTVRSLVVRVLREPKKAAEVAQNLGVTPRQAEEWLKRLTEEGVLERSEKPVRYSARRANPVSPHSPGGSAAKRARTRK